MINTKKTKLAVLLLTTSLLPFAPACTDAEIAGTIGAIAIGAGIAAGAGHHHHHGRHCRHHHHHGGYYGHYSSGIDESLDDVSSNLDSDRLSAPAFSKVFAMSFDASEKLIAAFEKAREGSLDAIIALGLSREDIDLLVRFSTPSVAGIEAVAKTLDQSVEAVRSLIEKIVEFGKQERDKAIDFRGRR